MESFSDAHLLWKHSCQHPYGGVAGDAFKISSPIKSSIASSIARQAEFLYVAAFGHYIAIENKLTRIALGPLCARDPFMLTRVQWPWLDTEFCRHKFLVPIVQQNTHLSWVLLWYQFQVFLRTFVWGWGWGYCEYLWISNQEIGKFFSMVTWRKIPRVSSL